MNVAARTEAHTDAHKSRERLRQIICEKSVQHGSFELASGSTSNLYFEMKEALLDPEGLELASEMIMDVIRKYPKVDAIGGLIIGACPIVAAVSLKSASDRPMAGFFVRKERKARGARQLIDGPVKANSNVIIVDDVTTQGGSVLQAVQAVRDELKSTVLAVITIVDREQGAEENLAKEGLELIPLFVKSEFEGWSQKVTR